MKSGTGVGRAVLHRRGSSHTEAGVKKSTGEAVTLNPDVQISKEDVDCAELEMVVADLV